jgi:hypothetical protein
VKKKRRHHRGQVKKRKVGLSKQLLGRSKKAGLSNRLMGRTERPKRMVLEETGWL